VYRGELPDELSAQLILRGQEAANRANPRDNARFRDFETVRAMLDDKTTSVYALQHKHALAGVVTLTHNPLHNLWNNSDVEFSMKTFGQYGQDSAIAVNFAQASLFDQEDTTGVSVDMWAEVPTADSVAIKRHRKVGFSVLGSDQMVTLVRRGEENRLTS